MRQEKRSAPVRALVLGAHPDDAEFHVGGLLARFVEQGFAVRVVSVTDGAAGHHEITGAALAARRRAEGEAAAARLGGTFVAWEFPDGALEPTLAVRARVIREIREYAPDLVLTHRLNDYHPDHRAVAQAVQDASYMVTVPAVVPEVPSLRRDPVVAYMPDAFTKPYPLRADVIVDVSAQVDFIVELLGEHRSQVFEWLPFNQGVLDRVPAGDAERHTWLREWYLGFKRPFLERYRDEVVAAFGAERAAGLEAVEILEISEYAAPLDGAARRRIFPFL